MSDIEHRQETWDAVWSSPGMAPVNDTVIETIDLPSVSSVLEVGAGSGRNLLELRRRGKKAFYLDFSRVAARGFADRAPGWPVYQADARSLPFADSSFDLVYSLGLIEHFNDEDQVQVVREKFRVTREYVLMDTPQFFAPEMVLRRILMRLNRWPYGEEFEFSYPRLMRLVRAAEPNARLVKRYGRELVPLPRALKQSVYGRIPYRLRRLYLSIQGPFAFAWAGSIGLLFAKANAAR